MSAISSHKTARLEVQRRRRARTHAHACARRHTHSAASFKPKCETSVCFERLQSMPRERFSHFRDSSLYFLQTECLGGARTLPMQTCTRTTSPPLPCSASGSSCRNWPTEVHLFFFFFCSSPTLSGCLCTSCSAARVRHVREL